SCGLTAQLPMQRADFGRAECTAADLEHGAAQAYRRSMFHRKAHGFIGAAKMTRDLRNCGGGVAAEEKFTRRMKHLSVHYSVFLPALAGLVSAPLALVVDGAWA